MSESAEPPVFGMPLSEILTHVWFDGFTSGAASGCGLFLPGEAADAKADELAGAAIRSLELRAQVQTEIQDRMRSLMEQTMKTGTPIAGLKPSNLIGDTRQSPISKEETIVSDQLGRTEDPFAGWTQARVGCHWSRSLSDGRAVHMSTWQCGGDSGYSLTINYERVEYPDLASALASFEQLDNESASSGYVR